MVSNVGQDLELSHQSFVLIGCGSLCERSEEKSGRQDNGLPPRQAGGIPALLVSAPPIALLTSSYSAEKAKSPDCFHYSYLLSQHPFDYSEAQCGDRVTH